MCEDIHRREKENNLVSTSLKKHFTLIFNNEKNYDDDFIVEDEAKPK